MHADLISDTNTLSALKTLGLKVPSPESAFRLIAKTIASNQKAHDDLFSRFWILSRQLKPETTLSAISQYRTELRIRTLTGKWRPFYSVLLAGDIVPGDGTRDDEATVDTKFHEPDEMLLRALGVTDVPCGGCDLRFEPQFDDFFWECTSAYRERDDLPHKPDWGYLTFTSYKGVGPLNVLTALSDEGKARYTDALMSLGACFKPCTMWHKGTNRSSYPKMEFHSLAIRMLWACGRIRTAAGVVPLADALGPSPKSPEALCALLAHPMADKLKAIFGLAEPDPEFFGEADPVPLTDVWPGLKGYLPADKKRCRLILCEQVLVVGQERECVFFAPNLYLAGNVDDDEQRKLQLVADEMGLGLNFPQVEEVLHRRTPQEVAARRAAVRQHSTDAKRLLAAVGVQALRAELPGSLLGVLESEGHPLTDVDVAEAAIATWHSGALKRHKSALEDLDPPSHWAGSARAVDFVRSLGFTSEWAGDRGSKRAPFVEVLCPYSLPELHPYQQRITENIRKMLLAGHGNGADRRGMVSLPTGSGKTRVAVQAIVRSDSR